MTAPQQKMDHHELFPRSQIKAGVINHFGAKQWFAVDSVKWKKKEKKRSQARNWAVTVYCSLETRRENQSSYIWKKQPTLMEKSADTPSARRVLVVLDSQSDCLFKNSPFTKIPQHIFHPLVRSDTVSGRCTKLWGSEKANRVQKHLGGRRLKKGKALDGYSKRALPPSDSFWNPSTEERYRVSNGEKSSELWMK